MRRALQLMANGAQRSLQAALQQWQDALEWEDEERDRVERAMHRVLRLLSGRERRARMKAFHQWHRGALQSKLVDEGARADETRAEWECKAREERDAGTMRRTVQLMMCAQLRMRDAAFHQWQRDTVQYNAEEGIHKRTMRRALQLMANGASRSMRAALQQWRATLVDLEAARQSVERGMLRATRMLAGRDERKRTAAFHQWFRELGGALSTFWCPI